MSQQTETNDAAFHNAKRAIQNFSDVWITKGPNEDMVKFSETLGKAMAMNGLATSQIRNIYTEIKRIQMSEFEDEQGSFYMLKPRVAYTYARAKNKGMELFYEVYNKAVAKVNGDKTFNNFCNLMEAILAYHKFQTEEMKK